MNGVKRVALVVEVYIRKLVQSFMDRYYKNAQYCTEGPGWKRGWA